MVHNDRWGHLPSCQIMYMTIVILLKMLVDVNDGSLSYGNDNNDDVDDKE